jgi:hypothetical protein
MRSHECMVFSFITTDAGVDMAANKGFTASGFLLRLLVALVLVLSTYNPSGHSYYHWVSRNLSDLNPWMALAGILLLIGWTIYLRATSSSLGVFGLILAAAFFGTLLWLVIDLGLVHANSLKAMTWIIEVILSGILAVGISWSHIRRRVTGQVDVDDVEDDN